MGAFKIFFAISLAVAATAPQFCFANTEYCNTLLLSDDQLIARVSEAYRRLLFEVGPSAITLEDLRAMKSPFELANENTTEKTSFAQGLSQLARVAARVQNKAALLAKLSKVVADATRARIKTEAKLHKQFVARDIARDDGDAIKLDREKWKGQVAAQASTDGHVVLVTTVIDWWNGKDRHHLILRPDETSFDHIKGPDNAYATLSHDGELTAFAIDRKVLVSDGISEKNFLEIPTGLLDQTIQVLPQTHRLFITGKEVRSGWDVEWDPGASEAQLELKYPNDISTLLFWDAEKRVLLWQKKFRRLTSAQPTSDGRFLLTGKSTGSLWLWNLQTGESETDLRIPSEQATVKLNRDGTKYFILRPHATVLLDPERHESEPMAVLPAGQIVLARDADKIIIQLSDKTLHLYDLANKTDFAIPFRLNSEEYSWNNWDTSGDISNRVVFSPSGTYVVIADKVNKPDSENHIYIVDTTSRRSWKKVLPVGHASRELRVVRIDNNGELTFVNAAGTVARWSLDELEPIK